MTLQQAHDARTASTPIAGEPVAVGTSRARRLLASALLGVADLAADALVFAGGLFLLSLIGFGILLPLMYLFAGNIYSSAFVVLIFIVLGGALLALAIVVLPWFLRGVGWFEIRRTNAVYGLQIVGPPRRRTARAGFRGFLKQWWLDASDSSPWRALAHLAAASLRTFVVGGAVLAGVGGGLALCFAPLARWQDSVVYVLHVPNWSLPLLGIAALAVGLAAAAGATPADRLLSRTILGVSEAAALRLLNDRLAAQRAGAVDAAADQRRRIERDLHDEVQPRLVSIAMTLGLAKGKLTSDPTAAGALLEEAHGATKDAITELRRLVQGFQPAVLADRGLDAALSAVVARCPVPTTLDTELPESGCSAESEAVVYFAVSEALTNVAKHARATRCAVQVLRTGDRLVATITDDGVGGASVGRRSDGALPSGGLTGMQDRAVAAGGCVRVASPAGGPTTVTVEVPCAS